MSSVINETLLAIKAALLIVWAGVKAIRGRAMADQFDNESDDQDDDDDDPSMPFYAFQCLGTWLKSVTNLST